MNHNIGFGYHAICSFKNFYKYCDNIITLRALDLVIMAFSTLNFYRYFYDIVKGLVHPN